MLLLSPSPADWTPPLPPNWRMRSTLLWQASTSLRWTLLLAAQKKMNVQGEMRVVGVNDTIMEIFEVTGFSEILTIE